LIDYRDREYPYFQSSPLKPGDGASDIWILYRADQNLFYLGHKIYVPITPFSSVWQQLSLDQYLSIWGIKLINGSLPTTAPFPNFWSKCLVVTSNQNNNPRVIWGRHPTFTTTNYKVFRAVSSIPAANPLTLSYSLIHTTTAANIFEYTDIDLRLGNWDYIYYYVKAYDSGTDTYSPISNIAQTRAGFYKENSEYSRSIISSNTFSLATNYPNPFNPSTTIGYQLPTKSFVTLKVYDVLGNEVAVLANEWQEAGSYSAQFTTSSAYGGKQLASGMYFYTLTAGKFTDTKKFILMK